MKPSANPGTASTFFVCTGPYDLKDGVPNAHDEIDIEFLGNDTTHVQFNFFVDGIGAGVNEYMYDLGFDASEDFHRYGFRWLPDSITWFVDGVPVYKVTTNTSVKEGGNLKVVEKLPSTAGRILTNYWCGNERAWGWMGTYVGDSKDQGTEYKWIKTSAEGAPLNPSDEPTPVLPTPDPECENGCYICGKCLSTTDACTDKCAGHVVAPEGEVAQLGEFWTSNDSYTVEGTNIKYSGLGNSFACAGVPVADLAAGKNTFTLTLTNNGAAVALVRVDVQGTTQVGNHSVINTSAKVGDINIGIDTLWGGSKLELAPGQSVTLVITYDEATDRGAVTNLVFFVDSCRGNGETYNSDITISNVTFTHDGEVVVPDPDPNPTPENPTSTDLSTTINGTEFTFDGNVADGYGVHADDTNNTIKVEYTNIVGNSYKNIWTNVSSVAGTRTTLSLKVTNNGTADAKFRIDMESQTKTSANTTCCNVSATMNGEYVWTDTNYGGTTFTIPAGQTVSIELVYDPSKLPTNVKFMIDSCQYDDSTSHAGEIVISEIVFSGEYTSVEGGEEPKMDYTDLYVEFKTENTEYTINVPDPANPWVNSVDIAFADVTNTWQNVNIWVADKSEGCSVFTMKVKNNGENTVNVWVQIKDANNADLQNSNKNIAPGAEEEITVDYSGTANVIYFFIDSTNAATEGATSGNVTLSGLKLGKVVADEEDDNDEEDNKEEEITPVYGDLWGFWKSSDYVITVSEDGKSATITYDGLVGSYQCVGCRLEELAKDNNKAVMLVTNNGTETIKILAKIQARNLDTDKDADVAEAWMDLPAGATWTLEIPYTVTDENAVASQILLHIDSMHSGETAYSGSITISNVYFITE